MWVEGNIVAFARVAVLKQREEARIALANVKGASENGNNNERVALFCVAMAEFTVFVLCKYAFHKFALRCVPSVAMSHAFINAKILMFHFHRLPICPHHESDNENDSNNF